MWALGATVSCGLIATGWSVAHLRSVVCAIRYDPARIHNALRRTPKVERLLASWGDERGSLEVELLTAIDQAVSAAAARRSANEALLDMDALWPRETPVRATCLRVAILGTILGVALLVAQGTAGSVALMDVLAVGGASAMVSWLAGTEAEKFIERRRKEIDALVDVGMTVRWGAAWATDQEHFDSTVQLGEPDANRGVDVPTR